MIIEPFQHCDKCDKNGYIVSNGIAYKCNCRKQYESNLRFYQSMLDSGLLTDNSTRIDFDLLKNYKLTNYVGEDKNKNIPKIEKFVDNFSDKTKPYYSIHQYWYGEQGTQKTTTVKGVLSLLAKQGFSVYYTFTKDLVSLIMESERDEEKAKQLDFIQNVDCLALDEFQSERMALYHSGYKQNVTTPWIKKRLEVIRKSTIFLSNDSIAKMKESDLGSLLGDVIDRETKYAQFEFTDNYGKNMNTDDLENQLKALWG